MPYREENEELRINFETLKQAFGTIQGKFRDSQTAHTATQQELARVVRDRDNKFMAWRSELELKMRQFEELKQQVIPPRELEEIKMRIAEELEVPHRQRCEMLEDELEKQREGFFQMRRQVEKLKMQNDQMRAEHEQNMAEAAEQHRAIEAELNIRIAGLQSAIEDTTEVEELHSLQREVEAFKARERQLLRELGDIRSEKEELRVAREKAGLDARDKVGEAQQRFLTAEAETEELRRRLVKQAALRAISSPFRRKRNGGGACSGGGGGGVMTVVWCVQVQAPGEGVAAGGRGTPPHGAEAPGLGAGECYGPSEGRRARGLDQQGQARGDSLTGARAADVGA